MCGLPQGRAALGRWSHSGLAPTFGGAALDGTNGWYGLAQQRLSGQAESDETPARGWTVVFKYGRADETVSEFGRHLMAGLVRVAPFGWEAAATGVMVSAVDLSDHAAAGFSANETTVEGFLRFPVLGFVSLAPDLQYVVHPSGARSMADAQVGTLRIEMAF